MKDIAPEISAIAGKYHYQKPPELMIKMQDLLEEIWRRIVDFLNSLRMPTGSTDSTVMAHFLQIAVICVAVIALVVACIYTIKRVGQIAAEDRKSDKYSSDQALNLDFAGWKNEGQKLAERSEWRQACRALYMAALHLFDEREIIDLAPTRTNYEYWYSLAPRNKELAVSFRSLVNLVEEIWFGHKEVSGADFDLCAQALANLEVEVALVQELTKREAAAVKA